MAPSTMFFGVKMEKINDLYLVMSFFMSFIKLVFIFVLLELIDNDSHRSTVSYFYPQVGYTDPASSSGKPEPVPPRSPGSSPLLSLPQDPQKQDLSFDSLPSIDEYSGKLPAVNSEIYLKAKNIATNERRQSKRIRKVKVKGFIDEYSETESEIEQHKIDCILGRDEVDEDYIPSKNNSDSDGDNYVSVSPTQPLVLISDPTTFMSTGSRDIQRGELAESSGLGHRDTLSVDREDSSEDEFNLDFMKGLQESRDSSSYISRHSKATQNNLSGAQRNLPCLSKERDLERKTFRFQSRLQLNESQRGEESMQGKKRLATLAQQKVELEKTWGKDSMLSRKQTKKEITGFENTEELDYKQLAVHKEFNKPQMINQESGLCIEDMEARLNQEKLVKHSKLKASPSTNKEEEQVDATTGEEDVKMPDKMNSEVNYDPFPGIEHVGSGVFRLPGKQRPIFVTPVENDCTLCGKRKRTAWCKHLISAGLRLDPPIRINPKKVFVKTLTHLEKSQKLTKEKSGRKRPRPFDYKDVDYNPSVENNNDRSVEDKNEDMLDIEGTDKQVENEKDDKAKVGSTGKAKKPRGIGPDGTAIEHQKPVKLRLYSLVILFQFFFQFCILNEWYCSKLDQGAWLMPPPRCKLWKGPGGKGV